MKKEFIGVVVNKLPKTAVVMVTRTKKHPIYKKTIKLTKKYHVHDPDNRANVGDQVRFVSCRPISHLKRFILIK